MLPNGLTLPKFILYCPGALSDAMGFRRDASKFKVNTSSLSLTPEEFHQGWATEFDRWLKHAIQEANNEWRDRCGFSYSSEEERLHKQEIERLRHCHVRPIQLALRCFLSSLSAEFKAAVVHHHWQTRFYQQLSPVIALVQMANLHRRYFELDDDFRERIEAQAERNEWLMGWLNANWTLMTSSAVVGIMIAFQWMKEHPSQFGRDAPVVDESLRPGKYDFTNQGFCELWIKYVVYLVFTSLLPPSTLQRETPFQFQNMAQRRWKLTQLQQWLTELELFPNTLKVLRAHTRVRGTICQILRAGAMCAAVRTTCKSMVVSMATEWATLTCLFVTPDIPGCHDECEGAGYHQGKAWSILFDLLGAMGCRTDDILITFLRTRNVSSQSTGSSGV